MAESGLPRDKLLSIANKLPATACVLGRLQVLLSDANSGLDDICNLLKRDTSLAARVMHISNSSFFGSATPNSSLEEAVGCIGFNEIYKVVGITVSAQLMARGLPQYGYSSECLWLNSLCSALSMESLAQFTGVNPRSAYTGGLFRSIGKMVLDRLGAEAKPPAPAFPTSGQPDVVSWERNLWACDNTAVTGLVLELWCFSPETIGTVKGHYAPNLADGAPTGPLLLNLAGGMAQSLGHGLPGEEPYWERRPEILSRLGLLPADLDLCLDETRMALEAILRVFAAAPDLASVGSQ